MKRWILMAMLALPAASEPQLFVRNQPFSGPVRWFPSRTLAPLDGLLESLGCNWKVEEGQLRVACTGSNSGSGPALREILPINLEGRPVRLEQHIQQDRIYVDVDQVAEALQCAFRRNSEGNLDLYAPLLSNGLGQGALKGLSDQAEFPIELKQVQVHPEGRDLAGFARLRNRGQQTLRRVLVRVGVYQRDGLLLARFGEVLQDLRPGQEAALQFPHLRCTRVPEGAVVTRVEFEAR